MKFITEYRSSEIAQGLIAHIRNKSRTPARLMEFCGSHTVNIFRYGIRQLLPPTIEMVSGPGCPICVTAAVDLDKAIALAQVPDVILTTFGDMIRIPGSRSSLQQAKAAGADVRIVYSTLDALKMAEENPGRPIVFLGIGFETTAPTVAASILIAEERGLANYFVFSMHKVCPPVIRAILDAVDVKLDGLICPGHVSTITGSRAWEFIAKEYGIPCVVAGFEPVDILQGIDVLISQIESGQPKVAIAFGRGVTTQGNLRAGTVMEQVFEPCPARWRGIGEIPASGLKLNEKYRRYDAELAFAIRVDDVSEQPGCICGEVLRGVKSPIDCQLFGKVCSPEHPVGPCMVSAEGCCSAYFKYGDSHG